MADSRNYTPRLQQKYKDVIHCGVSHWKISRIYAKSSSGTNIYQTGLKPVY